MQPHHLRDGIQANPHPLEGGTRSNPLIWSAALPDALCAQCTVHRETGKVSRAHIRFLRRTLTLQVLSCRYL